MSIAVVALVALVLAVAFVTVLALALSRSAALADRRQGPSDRRATPRPDAPGRRREDQLRAEVGALRRSLEYAEARLAEVEAARAEVSDRRAALERAEAELDDETARRASS